MSDSLQTHGLYIVHQPPLSVGFSRQEYWSGLPFPSPGDLPDPGFKPASPALASGFFTTVIRERTLVNQNYFKNKRITSFDLSLLMLPHQQDILNTGPIPYKTGSSPNKSQEKQLHFYSFYVIKKRRQMVTSCELFMSSSHYLQWHSQMRW